MSLEIDKINGRRAFSGKEGYLYFMVTAYLGIPYHPVFKKALKKGLQWYGGNYGSSRSANLSLSIYKEAECLLQELIGMEDSITFSSGYLAAQSLIHWLNLQGYQAFHLNGDHPALRLGSLEKSQASQSKLMESEEFLKVLREPILRPIAAFTTSVNPMTGKIYDFSWVEKVRSPLVLVVDDSHGLGILGKNGRGILDLIPLNPWVDMLMVSSLGKAMGIPGGVLSGSKSFLESIRKSSEYLSSSPISPAYLSAFLLSQHIYPEQRILLQEILNRIENLKFLEEFKPVLHPVLSLNSISEQKKKGKGESLPEFLLRKGILVSAFSYPSPKDPLSIRAVLNACHKPKDIKLMAQAIYSWLET